MSIPARSLRASCAALLLGDVADADRTARRCVRLSALAGLALLVATRRLWIPHETVPQIPFVPAAATVPHFVDVLLLGMLAAAWIVQGIVPGGRIGRGAALAACVALGGLVLLDQLRAQPWVWQLFVLNALFATESPSGIVAGARLVAVAIPFWSALSKLDVVFPVEHGALLVEGLGRATGLPVTTWPPGIRRALALAMPAGELLAALALLVPRTRRLGLVLVLVMHAALCAILGPWGLDHEVGVLVWNVACALQAGVLFGPGVRRPDPNRATNESGDPGSTSSSPPECASIVRGLADSTPGTLRRGSLARVGLIAARGGLALAVVVGPLLEPWDLWDHWPAWSLYAARPERVLLWVGADHAADLPESLRPFVDRPDWDERCRVRFDRWVLHELGAPVPPQGRVQLALAAVLARRTGPAGARVVLEGPAGRFDGRRERETFDGADAIEAALGRYVLGTQPRGHPGGDRDAEAGIRSSLRPGRGAGMSPRVKCSGTRGSERPRRSRPGGTEGARPLVRLRCLPLPLRGNTSCRGSSPRVPRRAVAAPLHPWLQPFAPAGRKTPEPLPNLSAASARSWEAPPTARGSCRPDPARVAAGLRG